MTEKRFTSEVFDDGLFRIEKITDNADGVCYKETDDVVDLLNELHEENEKLKQSYTQLKHRHSLLHDECLDLECDKDRYYKDVNSLEKENEQLKQQLNIFEKFLEENDLDIEWDEFCGVDECAFENPDFSCKECIHLKGDVE